MLHVWLIPILVLLVLLVVGFYLAVRKRGSADRTEGKVILDKPDEE